MTVSFRVGAGGKVNGIKVTIKNSNMESISVVLRFGYIKSRIKDT